MKKITSILLILLTAFLLGFATLSTTTFAGGEDDSMPLPFAGSSSDINFAGGEDDSMPLPFAGGEDDSMPLPFAGGEDDSMPLPFA